MLRPFLHVARPDDWAGRAAAAATGVVGLVLVLAALLARVPEAWVAAAGGRVIVVRVALVLGAVWVTVWVQALVYSRIPAAPYLIGRRLALPTWGLPRHVRTEDVVEVSVVLRPDPMGEVLAVTLRDGSQHDLCPMRWPGAGELYHHLARRVARRVR